MKFREQVIFEYPVYHSRITKGYTFKFYDMPVLGVGEDRSISKDLSSFVPEYLKNLCFEQIKDAEKYLPKKNLSPVSFIPEHILGYKCIDNVMMGLGPTHYEQIKFNGREGLQDIKGKIHEHFGIPRGWDYAIHLRNYDSYENRGTASNWLPHAIEFLPDVIELVKKLPFKVFGYVMILKINPKYGTTLHRDSYFKNNNIHLLNIVLNKKTTPFFVLDSCNKQKKYISHTAFLFNELDLHGSDPEADETYILRIDGIFEDHLCKQLGLVNGFVAHENYIPEKDFKNIKIYDFI